MSWREGRGLGYWYSCLRESCSVGSVLVCVSYYCRVRIECLVSLEYVFSLATGWTCIWSSSHHIHGSGAVGTFGVLELNRFCFGRLERRNPVIPTVRELADFSSSLNTLVFSSGWNCCFVFLWPRYSLTSSIILSCSPWSTISLFVYRPTRFSFCSQIFYMTSDVNIFS